MMACHGAASPAACHICCQPRSLKGSSDWPRMRVPPTGSPWRNNSTTVLASTLPPKRNVKSEKPTAEGRECDECEREDHRAPRHRERGAHLQYGNAAVVHCLDDDLQGAEAARRSGLCAGGQLCRC